MPLRVDTAQIAAGSAHSNSTSEVVVASRVFPANYFMSGKRIKVRAAIRTTAQNSTDTLTIRARFGPTTLTGTALFTSAAVDQVADDVCVIDLEFIVRDADSSGTLIACGMASPPDATGTAMVSIAPVPLTGLDFTAAQRFEITGQWSVANAGNSCQAEYFAVDELS